MSRENVELAREAFEAVSVGGIEALLLFYAPDVVVYPVPDWAEEAEYRGHDGVRRLNARFTGAFDGFRWELHELRDAGDRVVALVEMVARIKGSGIPISQKQGIVSSDYRDGMVGEVRFFASWRQALEAAGLPE